MTGVVVVSNGCRGVGVGGKRTKGEEERENQLSLIALLLAAIRRSMVSCRMERPAEDAVTTDLRHMEIGRPTDVRHVAHVTFDRFQGFLGLPVELELEIPCRVPSASASVFGVSAESMQCCYDDKGNSVPTILLLMQERLYIQGGLKAEGIFRINPENGQEEQVREQLNKGIVPDDIDVHCLAGLIKAWFRELPEGVLDGLSPEQVLRCNTEEECAELVERLLPTQAALLNWAIDLMADVVEEVEMNKMNARNIAMVFAPNMTQMSDPLTALMHAVQVMNLLKTLILKNLREREEADAGGYSSLSSSPPSDQRLGDDSDSQQGMDMRDELRETASDDDRDIYRQQEVDLSCGVSGKISDDHRTNYSTSPEGEDFEKEMEEFLFRRLEWKGEASNLGGDRITWGFSSGDHQVTQLTSSNSNNVGSSRSISESKHGSSSTSDEANSEASITKDVMIDTKSASKHIEDGHEVEMGGSEWSP